MKKFLIILAVLVTVSGLAAAQNIGAQQPDQAQQDRGQDSNQQTPTEPQQGGQDGTPDNPGGDAGPKKGKKPSLPEQASGTAKKVVGTVFGGISDSFSSIGDALSNLLGGNKGE